MKYLYLSFSPKMKIEGHFFETFTYNFECEGGGLIQRPVSIACEDLEFEEKRKILIEVDKILKIINLENIPSYNLILSQLIKPLLKSEKNEVIQ